MSLFMSPREVADRWGCSARQVQRLCQAGDLRAMQLGFRKWRIAVTEVERYEQRNTTSAETVQPAPAVERRPTQEVLGAPKNPRYPAMWGLDAAPTKKTGSQRH